MLIDGDAILKNAGIINYAYHGTSAYNAKQIIKTGTYKLSDGDNAYLGKGFYFYLLDVYSAKKWARKKFSNQSRAVIKSKVGLGNLLNINYKTSKYMKKMVERAKKVGEELTEGQAIEIVIDDILDSQGIKIDTVKRIFLKYQQDVLSVRTIQCIYESEIMEEGYCEAR
jgi:hypothetical protein